MKLLLDTHIFLWFISGDRRLPSAFRQEICDQSNEVFLSVVSIWEALVKHALGKLPLPAEPGLYLPAQRERHLISSLPLDEACVLQLPDLANTHRDPFDRMLICQALRHDMSLVTQDKIFTKYDVQLLPEK